MPASTEILAGLTAIANEWRAVAFVWHVLFGGFVVGLLSGWRPSRRMTAMFLATPLATVSALAWTNGNPFNAVMFAALAAGMAVMAAGLNRPTRVARRSLSFPGGLLLAFGWMYPHFLRTDDWTAYLYAAPLGLLPCPTLSAITGICLVVNLLDSRLVATLIAAAGVFYGFTGVARLGVGIDVILLAGAIWTGYAALRLSAPITPLQPRVRVRLPG